MDNQQLKNSAKALQDTLAQYRKTLHKHAEVGFDLPKTKAYIKETLQSIGLCPKDCGRASVIADIGKGKKTVLLRADMDALPIREKTGVEYACDTGNMHACGHDLHATALLGTATLLRRYEKQLNGKVRLLFQAGEERLEGAKDCIQNGVLDGIDSAVMLHVLPVLPSGTIIVAQGESAPSADYFTITIKGKACHGAMPQNGVDAIAIGARITLALEELISKETPTTANAVLTVGKFYGGTAGNAIADEVAIEGTLRCYGEKWRAFIKDGIERIAKGIAKCFLGKASVSFGGGCPSLINDENRVQEIYKALGQVFDERDVVLSSALPKTDGDGGGSEDFAYIAREVPSVMLALCAGLEKNPYPLHNAKVNFDESVLWKGALAYAMAVFAK